MSAKVSFGLLVAALVGLWSFSPTGRTAQEKPNLSSAHSFGNLSVFIVRGSDVVDAKKILTLQEALEKGLAVVHETSSVNLLSVENLSDDHELFLQSGDIVKGGKQDRIISEDMLVQAKSGKVPCPANCCEQSRWQPRGVEAAGKFEKSTDFAVGNDIKIANFQKQQSVVWANVAQAQKALSENVGKPITQNASPTSLQLALEDADLKKKVADYEKALGQLATQYPDAIGMVIAVNGEVISSDVYGSNLLFQKAWPKLLKSAAVDAVAQMPKDKVYVSASRWDAERFLAAKDSGPATNEMTIATQFANFANNDVNSWQLGHRVEINRAAVQQIELNATPGRQIQAAQTNGTANVIEEVQQLQQAAQPRFSGRSSATREANLQTAGANPQLPPPRVLANPAQVNDNSVRDVQAVAGLGQLPEPTPTPYFLEAPERPSRAQLQPAAQPGVVSIESRAPSQGNAVIHRGKLKK